MKLFTGRGNAEDRGRNSSTERLSSDLHDIHSVLTAIQGYAELAAKNASSARLPTRGLEEVVRGVQEIEKLLRRVEAGLRKKGILDKRNAPAAARAMKKKRSNKRRTAGTAS